ncbi:PH domain-containing protein [Alteraurantiacibacter aestuarii]|nr:PH domain-containing protein [Alteraurantiacibacter aestuarii]
MPEDKLTQLDPAYVTVMRIQAVLTAIPFVIGALVGEIGGMLMSGAFLVPVVLVAVFLILMVPLRRFNARGYDMADDRLRVVRGLLFRSDTVVPFSRVQHIDVEQGPLERAFGIARLVLHTAGTHNASVTLPGLAYDDAAAMREAIRAHVKRETM